jgi:hypothetical protein
VPVVLRHASSTSLQPVEACRNHQSSEETPDRGEALHGIHNNSFGRGWNVQVCADGCLNHDALDDGCRPSIIAVRAVGAPLTRHRQANQSEKHQEHDVENHEEP